MLFRSVALGIVHPSRIKRNDQVRAGDVLILGKALGVGIMSAALKKGELREKAYAQMVESTTQLNTAGIELAELAGVHAMTDVTGFGLAGHLHEICRGSKLHAEISFDALPILRAARHLAEAGYATGASERNWTSVGPHLSLPADLAPWKKKMLTDPQTSGGLLVSCDRTVAAQVLDIFKRQGFKYACEIGSLSTGPATITVS